MNQLPLDLLMFPALIAGILIGYPVAFTIAGIAVIFAFAGAALGQFDLTLLGALGQRVFGLLSNTVLIAIPLFVFMGVVLEKSRVAEDLLQTMGRLFGSLRGGLGISVVLVGALLAASTGIVGATVVAMSMIALPTMLRNKYDPAFASGIVCSSGTLGQIIPPSTLLIILSDVMSNAFQQAQFEQGKFTVETISVGEIFAAALVPGLLLVLIYIVYILIRSHLLPNDAPPVYNVNEPIKVAVVLRAVIAPVMLILVVLGSIVGGIASPTESAAVGAVGALLLAGLKLPGGKTLIRWGTGALLALPVLANVHAIRLQRDDATVLDWWVGALMLVMILLGLMALLTSIRRLAQDGGLKPALTSTMTVTAMIFATILTASVFSLVFVGLGGEERIVDILKAMPGGTNGALLFCMALIFILGFFLDFVEIAVIVLPVIAPILMIMGVDPIVLSILIALNLQTSFLTPPFGFSLFYMRGAAPKEITTGQIYRGVVPFIVLQVIAMLLIWLMPSVATYLPRTLF